LHILSEISQSQTTLPKLSRAKQRSSLSLAGNLRGHIKRLPLVRRAFDRSLWHFTGTGVYPSFAAAMEQIPKDRAIGYNTEAAAKMLRNWPIYQFKPSDYALFFHLRPLLTPGRKLVDFGGSVGITYYLLRQHLSFPEDFVWMVCDLPAVIESGRQMAATRDTPALRFTDKFTDAEGSDILICSGTVQYLDKSLADLLSSLQKMPTHLLINRTPIWDRETMFTLQNIADFTCVYRLMNRQEFIDPLLALGYRLVADWKCIESAFSVWFRPSLWLNSYHGFYFERI
jgi:putative methyltransferase (TIGR04325 family)